MILLYVLIAITGIARAIGAFVWSPLDDWQLATRVGLAAMFVLTGIAHFNRTRPDLVRMVPPSVPRPGLIVTLTGIAELAGAIGLLIPSVARWAAYALTLLLVAMFPANVHAARAGHTIRGRPHTPLTVRAGLQLLWIGLLVWSVS